MSISYSHADSIIRDRNATLVALVNELAIASDRRMRTLEIGRFNLPTGSQYPGMSTAVAQLVHANATTMESLEIHTYNHAVDAANVMQMCSKLKSISVNNQWMGVVRRLIDDAFLTIGQRQNIIKIVLQINHGGSHLVPNAQKVCAKLLEQYPQVQEVMLFS